ncbi:RAD51-associated protein 1 isoform X2 [Xiphophorus couchianus]|uniref:RAD51-associated protein 1 isoform X2 n=1 Tax=Xiphophorus couchianus TaxID=32473 RepID=UPI0010160565|nr:RAD51-associated protein 1 isoform X2 [Xiphophorus couchianus]
MDRPSRKTKVVNYYENKDLDDDEDFACSKAPPSKKAREETKHEQKKPSVRSSSPESNPTTPQSEKSRKPLDEKLYERDLEAAITLSLLNNSDGLNDSPTTNVKVQSPVDENTDPASLLLSNCSVDGAVLGLDEITSEKASPAARQRKISTKAAEVQRKKDEDEDEDYKPKLTPDSESDEDFSEPEESEDEEFTVKKSSKAKRKEKVSKKDKPKPSPAPRKEKKQSRSSLSKPQAAVSRSPPAAKLVPSKPASFSVKPVSSVSPAGGRIPKWNPPAQVGKSPTSSQTPAVKSPSAGLRLGLSRMVRVKPLHPSVTSH